MFYDLELSYQVNKSLRTWFTYGVLEENEAVTLSSNSCSARSRAVAASLMTTYKRPA